MPLLSKLSPAECVGCATKEVTTCVSVSLSVHVICCPHHYTDSVYVLVTASIDEFCPSLR